MKLVGVIILIVIFAGIGKTFHDGLEYLKKVTITCDGKTVIQCTSGVCKKRDGMECVHEK